MNEKHEFDLGIIGAGPAGYTAAFQARAKGMSVVLFEKDKVGGVCLNRGCIPTKAILHCAELYEEMKHSSELGINVKELSFDYRKVVERKDKVVEKIRKSLELALKNSGVLVVNFEGKVVSENKISANNELYECKNIISATGSSPKDFPNLSFDHE